MTSMANRTPSFSGALLAGVTSPIVMPLSNLLGFINGGNEATAPALSIIERSALLDAAWEPAATASEPAMLVRIVLRFMYFVRDRNVFSSVTIIQDDWIYCN